MIVGGKLRCDAAPLNVCEADGGDVVFDSSGRPVIVLPDGWSRMDVGGREIVICSNPACHFQIQARGHRFQPGYYDARMREWMSARQRRDDGRAA